MSCVVSNYLLTSLLMLLGVILSIYYLYNLLLMIFVSIVIILLFCCFFFFFFKQKTAYEMRISDWSSDVCSSDLRRTRNAEEKKKEEELPEPPGPVIYPFTAYGSEQLPKAEKILIKNATVWTNEAAGVLKGADVLIDKGKILEVGMGLREIGGEHV